MKALEKTPLFIQIRFFDEDWTPLDQLEIKNADFKAGIIIMDEFRDPEKGQNLRLELTEECGRPVAHCTGEVTLGKV
jgi:hypothetical protein